jgi:hypothetical protein
MQVESDKPLSERGTYLHPEAYGQSIEKQVDFTQLENLSKTEQIPSEPPKARR